ncbi:MAG TPA: phosphoenolpyruvate--protein phosphotransferase [Gemmatimonadales bacterium]|jgi:phosphocarrier protein FPr|nr:phosphoenolpyruvate--protein phosphotransferase [Gemmatimonadales bacterium]
MTSPSTSLTLLAPLSGVIVPLERVPDPAFARRLAGDGIALDPLDQRLVAPCDARVRHVHRAGHALTLSVSGLEVLIHVGLDSVALNGQGFEPRVKAGDEVRAGDLLLTFDADYVARHAKSLITPVLVVSMDRVAALQPRTGRVARARDPLLEVRLATVGAEPAAREEGRSVDSAPIVIAIEDGLHARPAATVAAAARRFASDVRLVKQGREANARSVVAIMMLEVCRGDTVTVVARGEDAAAAVDAVVQALSPASPAAQVTDRKRPVGVPAPSAAPVRPSGAPGGPLAGVPASPGVAIGRVFHLRHTDEVPQERAADPSHERRALDTAIADAQRQLKVLERRLAAEGDADRGAIFAAHQELLEDPALLDAAAEQIREGATAAYAWRKAYLEQSDRLLALRTELLAGRAADLRDVGRRVLHLLVGRDGALPEIPAESIVVAEDLAPSDAATLDRTRVRGFCTTTGSATSHVAILARGLGVPAVAGIDPRVLELPSGARVALDGDAGTLRLDPSPAEEAEIARRQASTARVRAAELAVAGQPAVTSDGHRVEVGANVGSLDEARRVAAVGGEGVGLLRSEFLFLDRHTAPTEDEQAAAYEAILREVGPERLVVVRALDVGGDKPLSYLPVSAEANPFLGERGIRLLLNRPEVFAVQVRAILRASRAGRLALMFPMISTVAEWRAARELVELQRLTLGAPPVPIGIMIETASAALLADHFAQEADFFSVGTNDLTQYTLAMDRTHPGLAAQVDALHPAVLRLIERTVAGAHAHGRWVGVCGAAAGDPQAVPVLVGLGVDELSAAVPLVPAVKAQVRALSLEECRVTALQALEAADGAEVRALVAGRHAGAPA